MLTTVVVKQHPGVCTIDCGIKGMVKPTDVVKGRPEVEVGTGGAEYGLLMWKDGDRDFKLGEKVELYPTHLDSTTNVYDRYYLARGEAIVGAWPIMGRAGAEQR
mgnify:CR=1 FL=1